MPGMPGLPGHAFAFDAQGQPLAQPGMTMPSPGMLQPGLPQPGFTQSSMTQPGLTQPGLMGLPGQAPPQAPDPGLAPVQGFGQTGMQPPPPGVPMPSGVPQPPPPNAMPPQQPPPPAASPAHAPPAPMPPAAPAPPPAPAPPAPSANTPPAPPASMPPAPPANVPPAPPANVPPAPPANMQQPPPADVQPPPAAPPTAPPPDTGSAIVPLSAALSSDSAPPPSAPAPAPPPKPPAPPPPQTGGDTVGDARRRAEEARHKMDEEQRKGQSAEDGRPPPTQEDEMEFQLRLGKFPSLDSKALNALSGLDVRDAAKALYELEQKGPGIRNPSAWICKTAQNVKDRQQAKATQPPPPPPEEKKEELGIVDHYGALDVPEDADETTIKKAYRKLVLKWHPDKNPDDRDGAEEKIRAINNAYETLSNATKRQTYDAQRQALQRQKRGQGPDLKTANMAPRQRIPREFMLQPIGFPDKFVRYGAEKARAQCDVTSRGDARMDGKGGLDQFVPFFKAAKLSLWWLPDVNNMCRIRALEARTRSSAGEKVVSGRPGGFNLGFTINLDAGGRESDLRLMEAGKGELNENVNFIVIPSPLYDNAFRFEAAYRRGYFLAFRPATQLRMIPYNGGAVPSKAVIDFTLVDFQAMFKFIDIEEVLRPVIEAHGGWLLLERLKVDTNVTAYFTNILQKPIWDDEDFQTYFEGHYEMWEFRCDSDGPAVRLRGVDERLGYALERVKDANEAAHLIVTSGDELKRLNWHLMIPAFQALAKTPAEGADDLSELVQRMEAQRRLLGALLGGVIATASKAALCELARLARVLQPLAADGTAPDVAQKAGDVRLALAKLILARAEAAHTGAVVDRVKIEDLQVFLSLPGMTNSDALVRIMSPPLAEASIETLLGILSAAKAAGSSAFALEAGQLLLRQACEEACEASEVASALQTLVANGILLDGCSATLQARSRTMPTEELAAIITALGEKSHESQELLAASRELKDRGAAELSKLPASSLLGLAVAATKTTSLAVCISVVVEGAVSVLNAWPAADVIRFLLAVAKAKKSGEDTGFWAALLQEAASTVAPHLGQLPAAELIRLALAAKTDVGQAGNADGGKKLLEAVAGEAVRRLSDLSQAHLLLLTQGLMPLGGRHPALRQICVFWGEALGDDSSATDEVSKRRKEMERGQALSGDQVAKLAMVLEPLSAGFDSDTADACFSGIGARVISTAKTMSKESRASLLKQVREGDGIGTWEKGRGQLVRALEVSKSKSRKRSSSSSRSKSRNKRGKKRKQSSSSSSRSRRRKKRSRS
eukprot:TRINITY_DN4489_c0_g1_i1.p1 TRINITY_DN4489_c0_g1~~TRINITY_DN4489_c0_g1_i1.p1  ORF type:complete len:1421 (+),score=382.29 TRINITY_DN4489_c0_g1_i1:385-4263(+)